MHVLRRHVHRPTRIPLVLESPPSLHPGGARRFNVGSITVDADLLDAADLLPGERVDVCDCTNGNRLSTYVIPGERGRGGICVNGAAAHLVSPGDIVILIGYSQMSDEEARTYLPSVVFVDERNQVVERGREPGDVPVDSDAARLSGLVPSGIPLTRARV